MTHRPKQRAPSRSLVLIASYGFEENRSLLRRIAHDSRSRVDYGGDKISISVWDQADVQAHLDGVARNLYACEQILSLLCFQRSRTYFIQKNTTRAAKTSRKTFSYLDRSRVPGIPANFKNVVWTRPMRIWSRFNQCKLQSGSSVNTPSQRSRVGCLWASCFCCHT